MKVVDGPSADLWGDLRESPAQAVGQFAAQEIRIDGSRTGIFMAIGHDQSLHVFFPVESAEDTSLPLRLTGIELAERQVMLVDGTPRLYLDLGSTSAYESMFTTVAREVAHAVAAEGREPRKAALQTIRRWQTFWKRPRGAELNRPEQIGLFGEVWLLAELIRALGVEVVERWTGPNGERHDFQGPATHLEVKATEKETPVFRISGLDQLQPAEDRALGLVAVMVREETGAAESLVTAVRAVEKLLEGHVVELEMFRQKLLDVGYRAEREEEWGRLRLLVRSVEVYLVDDRFPRLTPESFTTGMVPPGVVRVEYDVDLSAFAPLDGGERKRLLAGVGTAS